MSELIKVANKSDIAEGKAITVSANNKQIAIFNLAGQFYAIADECSHAGGPLSEGEVEGTTVTCPWHGATFNITTGDALSAPAFDGVSKFKVVVDGDDIKIEF